MNVRILKRPRGEAPVEVRDAWVGLSLPARYSRAVPWRGVGVLTGGRSWRAIWFGGFVVRLKELLGRGQGARGYVVEPAAAIDLLENVNPQAAAWWRSNASHLFKPGLFLLFEEECCAVEGRADNNSK